MTTYEKYNKLFIFKIINKLESCEKIGNLIPKNKEKREELLILIKQVLEKGDFSKLYNKKIVTFFEENYLIDYSFRASEIENIEELFKKIKKLPIKQQKRKTKKGYSILTSINLSRIFGENHDFSEIEEWLKKRSLSVAWDGNFGIMSSDMTFSYLLKTSLK